MNRIHKGNYTKIVKILLLLLLITGICTVTFSHEETAWAETADTGPPFLEITRLASTPDGFSIGPNNTFQIQLHNRGDISFRDVTVALTLPDGLSFGSGSNAESVGYMAIGQRKKLSFPIRVGKDAESKSYPISVEVSGVGYQADGYSTTRVFYVPVNGAASFSDEDIEISNVTLPDSVETEGSFTMSFQVKNHGEADTGRLKISAEAGEGIINKSRNVFTESSIKKGGLKNYSVTYYALKGDTEKSASIKITVEPDSTAKDKESISQYASVFISQAKGSAKKLQLIVDSYSYGGNAVRAGSKFNLHLRLLNTSSKELINIKAAATADNGIFVPVNGSNSFYVDSVPSRGSYEKSIQLSTSPQAEQKTTPITLALTYEDRQGNTYEASEVVSIPVTQETRLVCDEPLAPSECYTGQPTGSELQFYNMGKGTLYNLRVNVTGNFDAAESNSYYVGNMEGGKSDSYSFSFIPRTTGAMDGTVTFTYENGNGDTQTQQVPFSFMVSEMPEYMDEMGEIPPEDTGMSLKKKLMIGGGVAAVILILLLWIKKRRKRKKEALLDLEDMEV